MNPSKFLNKIFAIINIGTIRMVYLHIEKSAGTSQRIFLNDNFGEDRIFWYGINSDAKKFNLDEIQDRHLIGGHRFFDFYNNPNYIYLAVVREPIDSIVSLYSYFITQPHHMANWGLKDGFDASSLENTLNDCEEFRQRIKDHQCRYFSHDKLFNNAIKTIRKNNFMVGCLPQLALFNNSLFESLDLAVSPFPKTNTRKKGLNNKITLNLTSKKLLNDLLKNDILLYDYILNECNGLFNNINAKTWAKFIKKI